MNQVQQLHTILAKVSVPSSPSFTTLTLVHTLSNHNSSLELQTVVWSVITKNGSNIACLTYGGRCRAEEGLLGATKSANTLKH
jgi:hypothetical protein